MSMGLELPPTHSAASSANINYLTFLLTGTNPHDPAIPDYNSRSALHHAVLSSSVPCVRLLLHHSSFSLSPTAINALDDRCHTALSLAIQYTPPSPIAGEIITLLLRSGAYLTPALFLSSVERGGLDVVKTLLAVGGMMADTRDDRGRTATMIAIKHDHEEIVRLLLNFGASVYVKDNKGWGLMHHAAAAGAGDAMVLLLWNLGKGARCGTRVRDKKNRTVLHVLARGAVTTAWCLVECARMEREGLTGREEDEDGITAWERKVMQRDKKVSNWLWKSGMGEMMKTPT